MVREKGRDVAQKRVLVTGAYGLVGNVIFCRLASDPDRYDVYAFSRRRHQSDRLPQGTLCPVPESQLIVGDLTDLATIQGAVHGMDTVVHMAAEPSGQAGWESILHSNIIGSYHVFEACRLAGVKRVIFASSMQVNFGTKADEPYSSIYAGLHERLPTEIPPVTHEQPTRPTNLYASSKVWGEALAHTYAHTHGMSCICLRIAWVTAEDRPPVPDARYEWCSQRDIAQLVERCINAPDDVRFDVFYGASNGQYRWVDIEHARQVVGYEPQDWAEDNM
jgi:nucleoside-diphosphate-sugar epimerase